jgi:hypothetical protein
MVTSLLQKGASMHEPATMIELTTQQRKILEGYRRYRVNPPTLLRLLRLWIRSNVSTIAVTLLMIWIVYQTGIRSPFAMLMIGFMLGVMYRQIISLQQLVLFWPALSEALNWQTVDQLLSTPIRVARLQFRLSTAIIMMFCAAILVGLNANKGTLVDSNLGSTAEWTTYGFPFPFYYQGKSLTFSSSVKMPPVQKLQENFASQVNWDYENAFADALVLFFTMLLVRRICENYARKKASPTQGRCPPTAPPPTQPPQHV